MMISSRWPSRMGMLGNLIPDSRCQDVGQNAQAHPGRQRRCPRAPSCPSLHRRSSEPASAPPIASTKKTVLAARAHQPQPRQAKKKMLRNSDM